MLLGGWNQYLTNKGQDEFNAELMRISSSYVWPEAIVEVQGHQIKSGTEVEVELMIAEKTKFMLEDEFKPWTPSEGINQMEGYSDTDVFQMISRVGNDPSIEKLYKNGIYMMWAKGVKGNEDDLTVACKPTDFSEWPNLYPSVYDLRGKMIVGRVVIHDPEAVATWITLRLKTPTGVKVFSQGFKLRGNGVNYISPKRFVAFQIK